MANETTEVSTPPENVTFLELISTSEDSIPYVKHSPVLLDFAAACCIVFIVVGVFGNTVSSLALSRCPRLRNATTTFIVSLCVADIIFCVMSLPLSAVTYLHRKWIYGTTLCKLTFFFRAINCYVSLFTVAAIAINRYVLIVHPRWYSVLYRARNIGIMIASIWVFSFIILSLPLLEIWGRFGYDPRLVSCSILALNGKSSRKFIYAIGFGLPSLMLGFCYSRIYWVMRKSSKNVHKNCDRTVVQSSHEELHDIHQINDCSASISTRLDQLRKDKKRIGVLRVLLVLFVTFLICYFPATLITILQKENDWPVVNIIGSLGLYFSTCVNPVIYVVISREYRQAYRRLFNRLLKSNLSSGNTDITTSNM